MSKEEKMLNKDDLVAYKKYDNNQYSLIPGFGASKKLASPNPKKSPSGSPGMDKEAKLKKNVDRLAGYGLHHLGQSGSSPSLHDL